MCRPDDREDFPIIQTGLYTSMPDLARIPKERWLEALAPFSQIARGNAVRALRDPKEQFDAMLIAGDCAKADAEARAAGVLAATPTELARILIVRGTAR